MLFSLIFKGLIQKIIDRPIIYDATRKSLSVQYLKEKHPIEQAELTFIYLLKESDSNYRTRKDDLDTDFIPQQRKGIRKLNLKGGNWVYYFSSKWHFESFFYHTRSATSS